VLVTVLPKVVLVTVWSIWLDSFFGMLMLVDQLRGLILCGSMDLPLLFFFLLQIHILHGFSQSNSLFLFHPSLTSLNICGTWDNLRGFKWDHRGFFRIVSAGHSWIWLLDKGTTGS
jgi:hypothetical protein